MKTEFQLREEKRQTNKQSGKKERVKEKAHPDILWMTKSVTIYRREIK